MSGPAPEIGLDARKARDFGIGTYTRELAFAIAKSPRAGDLRFVLFVRDGDREIFSGLPENFSLEPADSPGYSLAELTVFARRVRRRRLSLFHAAHYVLPPFLATRAVVTVHDLIHLHPELSGKPWVYPYARLALSSSLSRARAVITGSHASRLEIEKRFPHASGKIEVIPHGIGEEFRRRPDAGAIEALSKKYGLPTRYALFLGGGRTHKNLARVLEAFRGAPADKGVGLVLAGPPARGERLRRLLSLPDLAGRVRVLGVVPGEDLPALYAGALLFLSPTLEEGFGLPALEAMASGTPVIASAIPVWRETCGDAAVFVDPRDPRSIGSAVARLASSPEERGRLRELGWRRVTQFSWEESARRTLEVYRAALGETRPLEGAQSFRGGTP
ncbi:MAG: glycosyltransferase family 4 protein [Thermoanaerobaculia bacterium]